MEKKKKGDLMKGEWFTDIKMRNETSFMLSSFYFQFISFILFFKKIFIFIYILIWLYQV